MSISIKPKVEIDIKAIEADLFVFAETFCSTVALEAVSMIKDFAFHEMIEYYNEYDPYVYIRTFKMRDHSYKKHYEKINNGFEGGIDIHSSNTYHPDKHISEEQIYEKVWVEGSRAIDKIQYRSAKNGDVAFFRKMQGEPYRIDNVKRKAYSNDTIQQLIAKGMKAALRQKYSILRFK